MQLNRRTFQPEVGYRLSKIVVWGLVWGLAWGVVLGGGALLELPGLQAAAQGKPRRAPSPPNYPTNVGGQTGTKPAIGRPMCQPPAAGKSPGSSSKQPPSLTALVVPSAVADQGQIQAVMTGPTPTLWIYVPYSSREIATAKLEVQQLEAVGAAKVIYQGMVRSHLRATKLPGLVGIPLSSGETPWQAGAYYRVKLTLDRFCGSQDRNAETVEATWQWQPAGPQTTLTGMALVDHYLAQGLWYDAIDAYQKMPRDRANAGRWEQLLKLVQLEGI